jgi:hypothetical protein
MDPKMELAMGWAMNFNSSIGNALACFFGT